MSFSEWKYWFRSLPWSLRWFPLLILIRPLVDNFYYLKNVSPVLSPLYIVGVLTPLLAIYGMAVIRRQQRSPVDVYFSVLTFLMLISVLFLFFYSTLSK